MVSANACWYFKSVADEAEQASLNVLARHTVASALEAVKNADTSGCDPVPEMIARFKKRINHFLVTKKPPSNCEGGFFVICCRLGGQILPTGFLRVTSFRSVT